MKNIKILYLHGLNSELHADRRNVLESNKIQVFAPSLDYENDSSILKRLIDEFKEVDAVIGSSAGGLAGYYFAAKLHKPALLFNPALPYRHYISDIPKFKRPLSFMQIVLGAQDKDVDAKQTFDFINETHLVDEPTEIHWINTLAHRFDIKIFSDELKYFLDKISS